MKPARPDNIDPEGRQVSLTGITTDFSQRGSSECCFYPSMVSLKYFVCYMYTEKLNSALEVNHWPQSSSRHGKTSRFIISLKCIYKTSSHMIPPNSEAIHYCSFPHKGQQKQEKFLDFRCPMLLKYQNKHYQEDEKVTILQF